MQFYYIHTDHQGSVIAITDADGDYVFQTTFDDSFIDSKTILIQ